MEVSNNGGRPQFSSRPQTAAPAPEAHAPVHHAKIPKNPKHKFLNMRGLFSILLIGIAILVIALIAFVISSSVKNESSYVNKSEYQSVFVNVTGSSGGQAYFGHIQEINSQYIVLTGVFYLEPGSTNNQFTLNNLSCALYNPQDTMIIKTDQVAFWENLKSSSQVTTDINKWYTDNLSCTSSSGSDTGATSSTGAVGSTPSTSTTTPSTTTTK